MYHRINTLADQERLLLEKKLALQSSIRAKRERQRRKRTHDTEVYSQMLEPVTKSIAKLTTPITKTTPSFRAAAATTAKLEPIKKEEDEGEEEKEPTTGEIEQLEQQQPVTIKEEEKEEEEEEEEEPDDLYQEALAMVPRVFRDDGQLGLCPSTHQIGVYTYSVVHGNTLQAVSNQNEDEEMHQFVIRDLNVWKLLLALNPNKIGLKLTTQEQHRQQQQQQQQQHGNEYLPFVQDYIHIANELNLLDSYTGSKTRVKYTLLTDNHWGSGIGSKRGGKFLFTPNPPPPPSLLPKVVVLPPDNQGLMSELYRAVGELRAGNATMRNLIVPMVREARRRRLRIPPGLLDEPEEDTWVLA